MTEKMEIYGKSPLPNFNEITTKMDLVNAETIDMPHPKPPFTRIKYYELDESGLVDLEELDKLEVVNPVNISKNMSSGEVYRRNLEAMAPKLLATLELCLECELDRQKNPLKDTMPYHEARIEQIKSVIAKAKGYKE